MNKLNESLLRGKIYRASIGNSDKRFSNYNSYEIENRVLDKCVFPLFLRKNLNKVK